jgi:hypothetical protein
MSEDLKVANSELLSSTLTMSAHPSPFEPICELMASKMTLRRQEVQARGPRVQGQKRKESQRSIRRQESKAGDYEEVENP